jgi:biopolymer transport protein ExbD
MKRPKRRRLIAIPCASMGDIAFLLIIFFVLCSRFAQEGIKIQQPRSVDTEEMKEQKMNVTVDADGLIYYQGREMPNADAIEYRVREAIGTKTNMDSRTVMFRCDRRVMRAVFEPVLEAISRGGGVIAAIGDEAEPTAPAAKTATGESKSEPQANLAASGDAGSPK